MLRQVKTAAKIGRGIHTFCATLVNNAHKLEAFTSSAAAKYGRRPFNESIDETHWVRLIER
jgi:hypothetical protein